MFHLCLFSALAPWIVVKTASIINDPINSLHWFLLSCQSDGELAGGELRHCLRSAFALNQHFVWLRSRGETAGLGADCWCSQFIAVMSFLLPEKPHSASLGISAQLWLATGNKASGKGRGKKGERLYAAPCRRPLQFFLTDIEVGIGRGWRSVMWRRKDRGGSETVTDTTLSKPCIGSKFTSSSSKIDKKGLTSLCLNIKGFTWYVSSSPWS